MNRHLPRWIANLTARNSRTRTRTIRRMTLSAPEALESRDLKTIGLVPSLGVIEVYGAGADDKVNVSIQVAQEPASNNMIDVKQTAGNVTTEKNCSRSTTSPIKESCGIARGSSSTAAAATTR